LYIGSHAPGSRPYSDLVNSWADSVCSRQLVLNPSFKGCPYNVGS